MSLAGDYFRMNLRVLAHMYRSLMHRTDKHLFTFLFNLQSTLSMRKVRCSWDGKHFIVSDRSLPDTRIRVRHTYIVNYNYRRGIRSRSYYLGECYFLDRIGFNDGDTVIDCGANIGDLKLWFDLNSYKVRYIGIEPSPVEFECLKANVSPSEVHNVGLWSEAGELDFYVSSEKADSSLIEPKEWDEKIKVNVARLEQYISGRVRCLKLEAEGAEPEILKGLGDKLHLVDYISADLGFERGVSQKSTLAPVTNYLLERGFELVDISHDRICALYRNKSCV